MTKRSIVPTVLFGGLAGLSAVATGWFALETYLLATDKDQPITWYTRNHISWHPAMTAFVCFASGLGAGAALTHFVGDESQ